MANTSSATGFLSGLSGGIGQGLQIASFAEQVRERKRKEAMEEMGMAKEQKKEALKLQAAEVYKTSLSDIQAMNPQNRLQLFGTETPTEAQLRSFAIKKAGDVFSSGGELVVGLQLQDIGMKLPEMEQEAGWKAEKRGMERSEEQRKAIEFPLKQREREVELGLKRQAGQAMMDVQAEQTQKIHAENAKRDSSIEVAGIQAARSGDFESAKRIFQNTSYGQYVEIVSPSQDGRGILVQFEGGKGTIFPSHYEQYVKKMYPKEVSGEEISLLNNLLKNRNDLVKRIGITDDPVEKASITAELDSVSQNIGLMMRKVGGGLDVPLVGVSSAQTKEALQKSIIGKQQEIQGLPEKHPYAQQIPVIGRLFEGKRPEAEKAQAEIEELQKAIAQLNQAGESDSATAGVKTQDVKMKFPDGSIRSVPREQMEIRKRQGGVIVP